MEGSSCCYAIELLFEAWKCEGMGCDVVGVKHLDVWVWGGCDCCDGRRVYPCVIAEANLPGWLVGLIIWIRRLWCRGRLWGIGVGETDWEFCWPWKFVVIKVFDS